MVQPLRDYVLLEKVPDEKKVGKIILATSNDNESALATVVAVGPGTVDNDGKKVEVIVKVGQKVIYKKYATTDCEDNGRKLMLVQDKDILAIVK